MRRFAEPAGERASRGCPALERDEAAREIRQYSLTARAFGASSSSCHAGIQRRVSANTVGADDMQIGKPGPGRRSALPRIVQRAPRGGCCADGRPLERHRTGASSSLLRPAAVVLERERSRTVAAPRPISRGKLDRARCSSDDVKKPSHEVASRRTTTRAAVRSLS